MIEEGKWITTEKALHDYALANDGECVIAKVKYFTCGGDPYAMCAFTSPDEARRKGAVNWDYYSTDEPYIYDEWGLEKS